MANFIDCWAKVSAKGYKHKDGSEVINGHDRAAILERINEHVKAGLSPAEAAKAAIESHISEADGQLNSVYEQAPGLKPKEAPAEAPPTGEPKVLLTPTVRIGEQSFKGKAHPLAIGEASKKLPANAPVEELFKPESQGFTATDPTTGKERFISRKEAADIFEKQTGKKPATPDKLTSEDLRDAGMLGHLEEKPPLEFWGYDPMTGAPKWKVPSQQSGRFTQITAEDAAKKGLSVEQNIPTKEQWDAKAPERAAAMADLKAKATEMFAKAKASSEITLKNRPVTEAEKTGEMYGESKWTHVEDVTDAQGNPIGKIRGNATPGLFQVKGANINKSERGKGVYQNVIRKLAEKYGAVQSDTDMQPAAEAAWKKVGAEQQPDGSYKLSSTKKIEQPTHVLEEPSKPSDNITAIEPEDFTKLVKKDVNAFTPKTPEELADFVVKSIVESTPKKGETPGKLLLMEFGIPKSDVMPLSEAEVLSELRSIAANPEGWKITPGTYKANQLEYLLKQAPKGIAASVREPGGLTGQSEAGAISIAPLQNLVRSAAPPVKAAVEAVKEIAQGAKETGKEALTAPRMTDYRRSVLNWSAKLQKSFGEAAAAQKDVQSRVPSEVRREGITNWIQADGDAAVLRQRAAATADPKLKAGYEAALALTPEEIAVANEVKQKYDALGQRGQGADVLKSFKDNYVTQIWDLGKTKSPTGGGTRTLKERFKFSKASTFPTFFDGEQAGYTPKTKDISKLLPVYMHEMNSVIAARQLVEQMSKGKASDGRPLVAPRGVGMPVEAGEGNVTLVMPKAVKGDTGDYKVLANQPALQGWRWASKDSVGNPVFLKSDLALHPEAYNRLKNVLGKSAIREWYSTPTTKLAEIPKAIVRGIDAANSETKRTMLGLLAVFHQVQEGFHGLGHRVSPFGNIPKVDLVGDVAQMDAAKHGLMLLPDRASEAQFMEGFRTSGLISRIPGIGPLADMYSNYLFKQYIPGMKFKTYEAILSRNQKVYADDLSSGRMKPEDVKVLSAEQANAAYGHLNYADLYRSPTLQHILQLGLLAPDFLEARGRFALQAAKGATGAKVGREQVIALATLALTQATAAFVTAKLSGGEWDKEHPFEFHVGNRKYTIRSVPEDISSLISNTRSFFHSRLSPIIGKGAFQYATGVDYAGRKVTPGQTTKELSTQWIPLTMRSLPGVRTLSGQDRPGSIKAWEQLAGAVGLKISRYNPRTKLNELHADWLKNNPDPKIKADYEQSQTATYPVSKYKALDAALADRDEDGAIKAISDLKAEGQKNKDILRRMRPFVGEGINSRTKPLFHESHKIETAFRNSLKPAEREEYKKAIEERKATYQEFLKVWRKRGTAPTTAPKTGLMIDFVPDAGQ